MIFTKYTSSISKTSVVECVYVKSKHFSTSANLRADESSREDIPDLVKSRATGKWDSSTVPDTDTDTSRWSHDLKSAEYSKRLHDLKDQFNKETDGTNFVESMSGLSTMDIGPKDVHSIAKAIDEFKETKDAQAEYDYYHDQINTAYAVSRDRNIYNRDMELKALEKGDFDFTDAELKKEQDKIINNYAELEKTNFDYASYIKGELRATIERDDITLRGLDETDPDSVENFEDGLREARNTSNSDDTASNNHIGSGLGEAYNSKSNDLTDDLLKTSTSKRPLEDIGEPESSRKIIKQDSTDVNSECDPFDFFSDE